MTASASAPSEPAPFTTFVKRRGTSVALALYVALLLPLLAPSLEDLDSANFALALRDYDVAAHQPHPPGYPVYVAMGRVSLAIVEAVTPLERMNAAALALALWSVLSAPVALIAAMRVYRAASPRSAGPAAVLLACAPVFVVTALRPMSDTPGLAAALGAQALLLHSLNDRRYLVLGAFAAGLAAGIRVQSVWLTAPMLLYVLDQRRHDVFAWRMRASVTAGLAGVLAWGVPMIAAAGGPARYLQALGAQAGEDLGGVDIVWSNPTPRRIALSLYETFVMPWGELWLAAAIGVFAAAGLVVGATRERRGLVLMAFLFTPYIVFHVLLQETVHVRYALPVMVPLAWLAVQGALAAGRTAPVLHAAIIAGSLVVASAGAVAFAREPHPAYRAVADMQRAAPVERPDAVFSHYSARRPLQVWGPDSVKVVEPPPRREWRDLIDYWRAGGAGRVWFLADARRTDLALIDPQSRREVTRYTWAASDRLELGAVRPRAVDWYRLDPPAWFAGDGWSLTAELGGETAAARTGVDVRPIEAMVRRRPDAAIAIVGARLLEGGGVTLSLAVDGRDVDRWALDPAQGPNVLRVIELTPGTLAGDGAYARVTIAAQPLQAGEPMPPVAVRQFDVQPASGLVWAFDEGWHEDEYDNGTGVHWRWSSGRSVLRILPSQGVRLRLRGESPLKYFDAPPRVRVMAGSRVVAEFRPDRDFEWSVTVPAADVSAAGGRIALETDPVYLPGAAEGTEDARRLGLRLFEIGLAPVLP